jgi:hypothetical protein
VHTKAGVQAVCPKIGTLILIAGAVFILAYLIPEDSWRMGLALSYQILMQITLHTLMNLQTLYHNADAETKDALGEVFGWNICLDPSKDLTTAFEEQFATPADGWIVPVAAVTALFIPFVLECVGEAVLIAEPATQQYDVEDSSGQPTGNVVNVDN